MIPGWYPCHKKKVGGKPNSRLSNVKVLQSKPNQDLEYSAFCPDYICLRVLCVPSHDVLPTHSSYTYSHKQCNCSQLVVATYGLMGGGRSALSVLIFIIQRYRQCAACLYNRCCLAFSVQQIPVIQNISRNLLLPSFYRQWKTW